MRVLPAQFRPALDQLPIDERMAKIKQAASKKAKPPTMAVQLVMKDILAAIGTETVDRSVITERIPYNKSDTIRYALRRLQAEGKIVLHGVKKWRVA